MLAVLKEQCISSTEKNIKCKCMQYITNRINNAQNMLVSNVVNVKPVSYRSPEKEKYEIPPGKVETEERQDGIVTK